uniref:G_PROTEIN_RECEP_F1_2 domain-containing protein n=2 Tax=Angiostrongylus cantonensis TaxID=6313 RepID=A0A0K0DIC4_ANGCA
MKRLTTIQSTQINDKKMILQAPLFGLDIEGIDYNIIVITTIIYAIITIFGMVTVTIFIAVLIKGRSTFKEHSFFTIVWQLTLSSALNLFAQATCIVPCTFLDSREGHLSKWYEIGAAIVDFTDIAVIFFVLLMALNRFAVLVMKPLEKIFTKSMVTIGTYNARTLAYESSIEDLLMQARMIRYDVIGLAETSRRHPFNAVYDTGEELFLGTCDSRGIGGVGVLVNTSLSMNIDSFEQLTTQIGRLRPKRCGSTLALTTFVVYAPTSNYDG